MLMLSVHNWNDTNMQKSEKKLVVANHDTLSLEEQQRFVAFGLVQNNSFHKLCPDVYIRIRARAG